jgi:hypothetical protein
MERGRRADRARRARAALPLLTEARIGAAALVASLLFSAARAAEVAGAKLDDEIVVAGVPLVLNGAGLRTRLMLKVYVAGLYVTERTTSADAVIDAKQPRRVHLVMRRAVGADTMWESFNQGIRLNASPAELAALAPRLAEVEQAFREIGEVAEGDVVDFAADGNGTIRYRGRPSGPFSGADLSRALLKIWLGAKPVQSDLKEALLQGS